MSEIRSVLSAQNFIKWVPKSLSLHPCSDVDANCDFGVRPSNATISSTRCYGSVCAVPERNGAFRRVTEKTLRRCSCQRFYQAAAVNRGLERMSGQPWEQVAQSDSLPYHALLDNN